MKKNKYLQPWNLRKYFRFDTPPDVISRFHNGMKRTGNGDPHRRYQIWMKRDYREKRDE
ncbi:MAG: hypothetical protein JW754_01965 [Candidatus Aenigmarchaeota archaeon]|nr:hypothetical protein [Candidatus Aenigmarchaeota archaeon]